jgi:hypothetical protein
VLALGERTGLGASTAAVFASIEAMTLYLYDVKGWPAIVWECERSAYARHTCMGAFNDRHELVRAYDAAVAIAVSSGAHAGRLTVEPASKRLPTPIGHGPISARGA